jgi:hypothetical protein
VKALLNHSDGDVTAIYARWHMFEEKREAVMAIEAAVLPLMPVAAAEVATRTPRKYSVTAEMFGTQTIGSSFDG